MLKLKELRKESGKRQSEIAKLIGVTQQTYANYENGRTEASYEILLRLSDIFQIPLETLLDSNKNSNIENFKIGNMKNLKEIRERKKITQMELSKLIGYEQSIISQWEHGTRDPNTEVLIKLSNVLKVSIDELLGNTTLKESTFLESIPESRKQLVNEILSLSDAEARDIENYIKGYKDAKRSSTINFFTGEK